MPACVPVNNNNVGDINGSAKPPVQSDSKLSKIISCLFLRKKTDVVDMTKESSAAAKKQKLSVDRSERSRRVLKMESMRTAPKTRDKSDPETRTQQGQNQMFLPSENPTASFLSYLNPSVRRACSEVIRTNSEQSKNNLGREAFTESRRKIHTRNTNYRGQQASENGSLKKGSKNHNSKPPKPPDRNNSVNRKPIVVPGIMSQSDEDIGYDSDNEISDLQDEMRRMNLSQPDLRRRTSNGKSRKREGSISLSEGSEDDEPEQISPEERQRPQNPSPSQKRTDPKPLVSKQPSMEEVIDDMFDQTAQNIDTIYKNGIESMDLETYRSDTMTPDTYMKKIEEDLLKSQADEHSKEEPIQNKHIIKKNELKEAENERQQVHSYKKNDDAKPHLDNLLTEVSIWAQDRQRWLLEDGDNAAGKELSTRESTVNSMTTDGRIIEQVTKTNKDKCNEWVTDKSNPESANKIIAETKANGILTGPKLFRSSSRNQSSPRFEISDKNRSTPEKQPESGSRDNVLQIIDIGRETEDLKELPVSDTTGLYPEPWTSDMYTNTAKGDQEDRSTINDNLSELDQQYHFRARSPDSWLSSNGSCSNVLNKSELVAADRNEGFEMTPTPTRQIETPVKITATNAGKSHQIMRLSPKVHAPFRGLDRQVTPMPVEPNPIPMKPILRNTQLKPLAVLRAAKQRNMIDTFPVLPGYKSSISSMPSDGNPAAYNSRPFSEIPLRTEFSDGDRNSSLLVHSSSARESRDKLEYSISQTSLRPVSETIPQKRIDKIGVGPIMATKEKQMYARDVMNAMEKHRMQPQTGAFQENQPASSSEPLIEYDDEKEKEGGRKRHKVFTNNLMTGGYSYDKHSRRKPSDKQPDVKPPETGDSVNFSPTEAPRSKNPATRSINSLSFSMGENSGKTNSPRRGESYSQIHSVANENFFDFQASPRRSNVSHSFSTGASEGAENKRGNKSQSFQNKYTAVQSHGLGISPSHGLGLQTSTNGAQSQTANKFRKMRSRRDQEMDWLMRDAAETEV
ncbi:uncharacterized protein LOC132740601 isoform X2 [Ruditapes philippinarum]|uniref:uncharacterized protein LOC132740601 isoform X2 n=1 Tax=Ruditapes philippinarum TaxID=129788 RepID=UPI00295B8610|nr:uncharacterized protein LOC132740601 isoform X2 [Ruditapes philippinarum]